MREKAHALGFDYAEKPRAEITPFGYVTDAWLLKGGESLYSVSWVDDRNVGGQFEFRYSPSCKKVALAGLLQQARTA